MPPRLFTTLSALALAFVATVPALTAKTSTWKDQQGVVFKGEPVEVIGPFALFRTANNGGRRVLLRGLPPEDCVRFYQETAARPPRAVSLAVAKSPIAVDLVGSVSVVRDRQLVPADLAARPEPEVFVLLYGSRNDGESYLMVRNFVPTYERIRAVYPGLCDTIFFGLREKASEHREFALGTYLPWLVTDYDEQASMTALSRFAPAEGILMLAVSRHGVPLLSSRARNLGEIRQFIDDLSGLLRAIDSESPAAWTDRIHYLNATRPVQFARDRAAPALIGTPLRQDVLRRRGVTRVQARLEVGIDGRVTAATVDPACPLPEALAPAIADALRRGAVFSPAIEAGKPVASTFDYVLDIPAEDTRAPADLAWMHGDARRDLPLPSWFVLRPIPVPEQSFSSVTHVTESGVNVLSDFEVSDEKVGRLRQLNSFNSDWFTPAGADSVRPAEGAIQNIDDRDLAWKELKANDGFVDLQGVLRQDYCIGYAWTEFEVPQDTDGWFGIGSDDGLKIWLNGELVCDHWIRRDSRIDDDIVPLRLKAGKNRLLIKIQNATGDWSFVSRLRVR